MASDYETRERMWPQ